MSLRINCRDLHGCQCHIWVDSIWYWCLIFNPFTPRFKPWVNKCVCNFWVCGWNQCVTIQMKAIEQYVLVVLFVFDKFAKWNLGDWRWHYSATCNAKALAMSRSVIGAFSFMAFLSVNRLLENNIDILKFALKLQFKEIFHCWNKFSYH